MDSKSGVEGGIDRIAPTLRPDRWTAMRQIWRHVLFLHWRVPPERLLPLLPPGLELDVYDGEAYVGLIPFTMAGVRPALCPPVPFLSSFHETNVRTYVHVGGRDPGVWFFSLDASSTPAVVGARALMNLPYFRARIDMTVGPDGPTIDYQLRRRWPGPKSAACDVRYAPRGPVSPAVPGSLEHFLVERYILYHVVRGRLHRARVHHAPWPLQGADVSMRHESLTAAAGIDRPDGPPLIHYGREVRVEIFGTERVGRPED